MRTTVDLDPLILAELKKRQRSQGKTLGELVSELLAPALLATTPPAVDFVWPTRSMRALVDIDDKDVLFSAMDAS